MGNLDLATKLMNLPPVRVLVVGDAMTDVDLHGRFERFAQESPHVPIFKINRREERPGGAGAVAAMVTALGGTASLLAQTTAIKTRRWVDGVMVGRDDSDALDCSSPPEGVIHDLVSRADVVLVADYGKGFCSDRVLSTVFGAAADESKLVIVDPARGKDWRAYAGAGGTVIKCNSIEWSEFIGPHSPNISIFRKVVITDGSRGMVLTSHEPGSGSQFAAKRRRGVDVTGCGDMVLACLGVCVGGGMSWEDACRVANCAAGLKVERRGAVPVSRSEVLGDLCGGEKILPLNLLVEIVNGRKECGQEVAFTNGCFDILHPGHMQYLREARAQADLLIVGLNSDDSVSALKGTGRPVQTEDARSAILAGLQVVDFVVMFNDDTPVRLIEAIKPDVLVKGADYCRDQVAGADFVESYGGRVHLAELRRGYSTTRLIDEARMSYSTRGK